MNYCALDDAFQEIGGAPSPGCGMDSYATKAARKEERRKARRCKGPAATYLDVNDQDQDQDPDRQQYQKAPSVPAMNSAIGMREHVPVIAPQEDVSDKNFMAAEPRLCQSAPMATDTMKPARRKKFFGADPSSDADAFADYVPEQDNYRLQPDFMTAFEHAGVAKAGSAAMGLPNPSVNMFWKPLTPSGTQTSFIEQLPPPGGKYYRQQNGVEVSMDEVMKRMDKLFARLDDMNTSSPEQITSELMMFTFSGIFVLFMMDLLVRKGSTMRF